jgi:peptidoglycan/LPS O-acetylase OafA/YrhL
MLLLDVSLNLTLWALQLEMLMVPVLLVLYFAERRWGPRALLMIALATTALAFLPRWAIWPPLSANLFSFVLGMLVPTLGQQMAWSVTERKANLLSVLMMLTMCLTSPLIGTFSLYSAILEAYAGFVLISLIAYRSELVFSKLLKPSALQWIGAASGSLYVLHMATIPPTMLLVQSLNLPAWMVVPVWIVLLIPLSRLTYRLIESPGIVAGKYVVSWLSRKPPVTATTQVLVQKAA